MTCSALGLGTRHRPQTGPQTASASKNDTVAGLPITAANAINNQQARMHPRHILQLLITSALWRCGQCQNSTFTVQPTKKPTRKPSMKNTKIPTLRPTIHTKWGGCTGDASVGTTIQRGAPTAVCMTIGPSGDWSSGAQVVRYSFTPSADQFSRFTIPGSYKDLVMNQKVGLKGNITVFTASQTAVSFLRLFHDSTNNYTFPHLTAIIDVTNGAVNGITWDDACVFCGANRCRENTLNFTGHMAYENSTKGIGPTKGCYFTQAECEKIVLQGGTDCDLSLYVAWTGTDNRGKALFSSTSRFSAFSSKSVYSQFTDGLYKVLGSSFFTNIFG